MRKIHVEHMDLPVTKFVSETWDETDPCPPAPTAPPISNAPPLVLVWWKSRLTKFVLETRDATGVEFGMIVFLFKV